MRLKNLSLIGLVAIVIVCCSPKKNDITWQEASGNVKSIRTTGYEATEKFGEISEGDVLYGENINNMIVFNQDGYITEISYFNHSGNLEKKSVYVFDSDGKVIKINHYDGDGDILGRTVYTYNEDGKCVQIVDYDKSGKINYTQKMEWDGDKCIKNQFINEYAEGNYTINEFKGNSLVKSVAYDKNGKQTGEYMEYENDKIIRVVNSEYIINLTYNDKGLCTSIVNGQLYNTNSLRWSKGESYIYEYEYDNKGNWVRKIEKEKQSKKAERIFIREIEYY